MTTTTALTITQLLAQLDGYPDKTVVRINWCDGEFGLLLVEEVRAALHSGKVFDRPTDQIDSLEFLPHRHLIEVQSRKRRSEW